MRVLHVIDSLSEDTGGPARTVPALCENLATLNATVHLAFRHRSPEILLRDNHDVHLHHLRSGILGWGLKRQIAQLIENHRIDIVHVHGMWLPINHSAITAARQKGRKLVVSPRGMLTPWAMNHGAWKKRLAWYAFNRRDIASADAIHATASQEAHELRALGLTNPISIFPNGIYAPATSVQTCSGGTGDRRVVFLSRIHQKKGLANLVNAWAHLRPSGWRLVIAGNDDGGYQRQVERMVADRGLKDSVEFAGAIPNHEKYELLRTAELFVLPTFSENFGVVVAEALAVGLPTITTKGAPWQELESNQCGWWIEVGVDPLAAALREATTMNPANLRAMGVRGRKLVEKKYSWGAIGQSAHATYDWLLGNVDCPHHVEIGA